jgi:hypothetical protein
VIKRHIIQVRKLTEDRYSSGTNMRLPGNADATGRPIGGMSARFPGGVPVGAAPASHTSGIRVGRRRGKRAAREDVRSSSMPGGIG